MYNNTKADATRASIATYGNVLATALISHAKEHVNFAHWLTGLIVHCQIDTKNVDTFMDLDGPGLHFQDTETAVRKALWLLDAVSEKRIEGYEDAATMLAAWAQGREWDEPKAVVLGLKYGVLNFGIIGYPKKRAEPMDVLLREDIAQQGFDAPLARSLASLTNSVVEQGLIAANGKTGKLEPELGDWLFGDKALALYRAPNALLASIEQFTKNLGFPYAALKDRQGIMLLALSPTLYLSDVPDSDALVPLEDN